MAKLRTSVAIQEQILELKNKGYGRREIARVLGISKNTVKRILRESETDGVTESTPVPPWAERLNWEELRREYGLGATLSVLHKEHAPEVNYTTFWRRFRGLVAPDVSMRLRHNAGEKAFFDFADGIKVYDAVTGLERETNLFCGVLAFSSLTYAEFTWTQKREDLIRPIENAFQYFGGVTPYVTVDNQRAAVNRAHVYDPEANKIFVDFSNHMGFAVIPARPYKPRDKAVNESNIGVIQRQFYQEVRHRRFTSLTELNVALRSYIERLNSGKMKDWGLSRRERFEGERSLLKPCPSARFELSEWKKAKVHSDCHVQVGRKFYSVPFKYVSQIVHVRITQKLIEVFDGELKSIAVHEKLTGTQVYQTNESHYPEEKLQVTNFSIKKALQDADRVGPETLKLVSSLLTAPQPLRYLRRCQGILRLFESKRLSREAMEFAAKQGLTFNRTQYEYIKSTALCFDQKGLRPQRSLPVRDPDLIYLHNQPMEEKHDQ